MNIYRLLRKLIYRFLTVCYNRSVNVSDWLVRSQSNEWLKFHLDQIIKKIFIEKFHLITWYWKVSLQRCWDLFMVLNTLLFVSYVSPSKWKKINTYSIHFIIESELTNSASPMLVFYSIFNEALLPSEIFSPIDSMLKQVIQMKMNLRVLSKLKA